MQDRKSCFHHRKIISHRLAFGIELPSVGQCAMIYRVNNNDKGKNQCESVEAYLNRIDR